jgi:hypothetical protein
LKIGRARRWRHADIMKWIDLDCPNLEIFKQLVRGA